MLQGSMIPRYRTSAYYFHLKGLDKDMLVKILKNRKRDIETVPEAVALDEVNLRFDDSALEAIAKRQWKKIQEPVPCVRSSKNFCWTSCMRSRKMTVSDRLRSQESILKEPESDHWN